MIGVYSFDGNHGMTMGRKYFEWSDAWVMAALFGYNDQFQQIELSKVIAFGDMLNHAIFLPNELSKDYPNLSLVVSLKLMNRNFD